MQTVSEIVTVNCRCSAKTIASAGIDQISYKQCSGAQLYDYQGLNLTGTSFSSTRQIAVDTVQVYVGPPPRSCAAIPLPAFGPAQVPESGGRLHYHLVPLLRAICDVLRASVPDVSLMPLLSDVPHNSSKVPPSPSTRTLTHPRSRTVHTHAYA